MNTLKKKIKSQIFTAVSAAVLLAFSCAPKVYADDVAGAERGPFRIASVNMYTTGKCDIVYESEGKTYDRGQIIMDLLKSEGVDSAGLCEVTVKWMDYLDSVCGDTKDYAIAGKTSCSGSVLAGGGNEYTPILYRTDKFELVEEGGWWLSDTPDEQSKIIISGRQSMKYHRTVAYAVLKSRETGEIAYIHMNTHFDHKSEDYINTMCSKIVVEKAAYLKDRFGDVPFVVTGDFNFNEETRAYKYLANSENGFTNAKYLTEDRDESPTFVGFLDNFHPELHKKKVIDHVFVSVGNVETVRSRVVHNQYFSDHSVVLSDLLMNDNGSGIAALTDLVNETASRSSDEENTNHSTDSEASTEASSSETSATVAQTDATGSKASADEQGSGDSAVSQNPGETSAPGSAIPFSMGLTGIIAGFAIIVLLILLVLKRRRK